MADYIQWIRSKVGHERVFFNVCAAFIENERGEILMQRRGDFTKESWGVPGGGMEIGESAEETLKREIKEETGLEVAVTRFLGVYTEHTLVEYQNGDQCHMILLMFVCKPIGGTLQADGVETKELKYFDVNNHPPFYREHLEIAFKDYCAGVSGIAR